MGRGGQRLLMPGPGSRRRFLLHAAAALGSAALGACERLTGSRAGKLPLTGGFDGPGFERGHALRAALATGLERPPDDTRRTSVAIIGAGISGLAAARAVQRGGIDDCRLFELEAEVGGNSRGGSIAGLACPWGAHYLPVPGPAADDIAELLTELRLRTVVAGQPVYDPLHLAHAPHERLWLPDRQRWQDGIRPGEGLDPAARTQFRRFAALVRAESSAGRYAIPTRAAGWDAHLAALDSQTFAAWLDGHGLTATPLRWYLDYCCRDDYGAGSARVSAWAGLHYFASRHGFAAPGDDEAVDEPVLTWPQGNAWLVERLAAPHRERIQVGAMTLRVTESAAGVEIDVLDQARQRITRWQADAAIVATPLFMAARLVAHPPEALRMAARALDYAPWLVANLHVRAPLDAARDQPPLSWDNVLYGSTGLGYVNAGNQSLRSHDGPTALTCYRAFGDDPAAGRAALLAQDWRHWADALLGELSGPHPDLRAKLGEIRIGRHGHAMAIPTPGVRGSDWLAALLAPRGRIAFAHADLSGHSVFEEAWDHGLRAGEAIARALRR
jgi:monoamine oxidase